MTAAGNRSKLATFEICQDCGRCCTSFSWTETPDQALRFLWMKDPDITVENTPFRFPDGEEIKIVTMNKPCKMLEIKAGKYICKAYGKRRPEFCSTYPDIIFAGMRRHERARIQQALDYEKKSCPALRGLTADDIIARLYL